MGPKKQFWPIRIELSKPFRRQLTHYAEKFLHELFSGINARRREDLETHDISCIWLEISPPKSKSFLAGNMYRPPDSRVEYNDRFEEFIDSLIDENKEFILLGDFTKIY